MRNIIKTYKDEELKNQKKKRRKIVDEIQNLPMKHIIANVDQMKAELEKGCSLSCQSSDVNPDDDYKSIDFTFENYLQKRLNGGSFLSEPLAIENSLYRIQFYPNGN